MKSTDKRLNGLLIDCGLVTIRSCTLCNSSKTTDAVLLPCLHLPFVRKRAESMYRSLTQTPDYYLILSARRSAMGCCFKGNDPLKNQNTRRDVQYILSCGSGFKGTQSVSATPRTVTFILGVQRPPFPTRRQHPSAIRSEVESDLPGYAPRRHIMCAAESRQKIVQRVFVRHVDERELCADLVFVTVE